MKFVQLLLFMLYGASVSATCYNVDIPDHSCRHRIGDAWCKEKRLPAFAYRDTNCIEAHPNKKWLQIASRRTPEEAWEIAREYKKQIDTTKVFLAQNGVYAVTLGSVDGPAQDELLVSLISRNAIPPDSLYVSGRKWLYEVADSSDYRATNNAQRLLPPASADISSRSQEQQTASNERAQAIPAGNAYSESSEQSGDYDWVGAAAGLLGLAIGGYVLSQMLSEDDGSEDVPIDYCARADPWDPACKPPPPVEDPPYRPDTSAGCRWGDRALGNCR